jgi:WD40 repeat protein
MTKLDRFPLLKLQGPSGPEPAVAHDWASLPADLIRRVFSRLCGRDLARVCLVSKAWDAAANDKTLWRRHASELHRPCDGSVSVLKAECSHALQTEANILTGKFISKDIKIPVFHAIKYLYWNADGSKLVATYSDSHAEIFDLAKGTAERLFSFGERINEVAWSFDCNHIAAVAGVGISTVHVIDMNTRNPALGVDRHFRTSSIGWSPVSSELAVGSEYGAVRLINVVTSSCSILVEHGEIVESIIWSPDGKKLALTTCQDLKLHIIDTMASTKTVCFEHNDYLANVVWSPDSSKIIVNLNRSVRTIDMATGSMATIIDYDRGGIREVNLSPDGNKLAVIMGDIRIFDVANGSETARISSTKNALSLIPVCWSPDGSRLATGNSNGTLRIINVDSSTDTFQVNSGRDITSVDWSPDGKRVALGTFKGAHIIDMTTLNEEARFNLNWAVHKIHWNSDGSKLILQLDCGNFHIADFAPNKGQPGHGDKTTHSKLPFWCCSGFQSKPGNKIMSRVRLLSGLFVFQF